MDTTLSSRVYVSEASQIGEARRVAFTKAEEIGFNEQRRAEVGIVVTELATNLVLHTAGGQILLRSVASGDNHGIEILSLDRGPGMADVLKCLQDGYSSAGTPGNGLGAIQRLSSEFDIHSNTSSGTAILARIWASRTPPRPTLSSATLSLDIGVVCVPLKGEIRSGDSWFVHTGAQSIRCVLVDGLGHGPVAAEAAGAALDVFRTMPDRALEPLLNTMHNGIKHTRGAAVAIADVNNDSVSYAGVGNINGAIVSDISTKTMISYNGTVGHSFHKAKELAYPMTPKSLIIMHSDGLSAHWRFDSYPGLLGRHPSLIAGVLYRDFARERDDVTVLVARKDGSVQQ